MKSFKKPDDDLVSAARSRNMAAIRSKNTKPELLIRKALHAKGARYKLHDINLPGKPDLVFPKYHAALFVNGCFWHGHNCPAFHWPKTRTDFWQDKIGKNIIRDQSTLAALNSSGWRVCTIWECALKGKNRLIFHEVIDSVMNWLSSDVKDICIEGKKLVQSACCSTEPNGRTRC